MTCRSTWPAQAIAELKAIRPGERGALGRIADRYGKSRSQVADKLQRLRIAGEAADVPRKSLPRSMCTGT